MSNLEAGTGAREKRCSAPLVSIIMPCYNAAGYLDGIVDALERQPYTNWELVAVDDASPDGTAGVLRRRAAEDDRIRPVVLERNGGAAAARNAGIERAAGSLVWFLDPDDTFEGDLLVIAVSELLDSDAEIIVFGCSEERVDSAEEVRGRREVLPPVEGTLEGDGLRRSILRLEESTLYGYAWNKVYRRETIGDARFPDMLLAEDLLFNVKVFYQVERAVFVRRALYHYRKRLGENLTNRFDEHYFDEHRARIKALYDQQVRWGLDDAGARSRLGVLYGRYIISALERNCDSRAGMIHADRVAWCYQLFDDPLFLLLVSEAHTGSGGVLEVCLTVLRTRRPCLLLLLGRAVHITRSASAPLYSRLKNQR